jgi:hypothetical protein
LIATGSTNDAAPSAWQGEQEAAQKRQGSSKYGHRRNAKRPEPKRQADWWKHWGYYEHSRNLQLGLDPLSQVKPT